MSALITEDQLQACTGYSQRGRIETWLRQQGIRYWRGKDGRLITTTALMEAAALGQHAANHRPPAITFGKTA